MNLLRILLSKLELDMCLWNTDAPGGNKSQNMAKIAKS